MAATRFYHLIFILSIVAFTGISIAAAHDDDDGENTKAVDTGDQPQLAEEELDYHKGSLCGYCTYCKFCKLCDKDCPCEVGPGKPNCHMCKYCKYCYLCKMCDTVCQPGGIIDVVTSKLFNALPRYNKEDIDKDIDGVQNWIEKTKEEL